MIRGISGGQKKRVTTGSLYFLKILLLHGLLLNRRPNMN